MVSMMAGRAIFHEKRTTGMTLRSFSMVRSWNLAKLRPETTISTGLPAKCVMP